MRFDARLTLMFHGLWGGKMDFIKYEWIGIFFFFLILVSIQFSLNKIVVLLQEVIKLLKIRKS